MAVYNEIYKVCPSCGIEKPSVQFIYGRVKRKKCQDCIRKEARDSRAQRTEYMRVYRDKNPEREKQLTNIRRKAAIRLAKEFPEEYERIYQTMLKEAGIILGPQRGWVRKDDV